MKKAFIFGVNKEKLNYADSDATKIKDALNAEFDIYPHDTSKLIAKDFPSVLQSFYNDLEKEDIALFYFAGHSFLGTNNRLYLAVETSDLLVETSCLCMINVITEIEQCPAKNKIIILDSCNSAAIFKTADIDLLKTNYVIICATEAWLEVKEIESVDFQGGLLTHLLSRAFLFREAVDTQGKITTSSLIGWMKYEENNYSLNNKINSSIQFLTIGTFVLLDLVPNILRGAMDDDLMNKKIPSKCFEYLEIVEMLDNDFPLERIGQNEVSNWELFLKFTQTCSIIPEQSLRLFPQINSSFSLLTYDKKRDLIVFFRKHLEVEVLLEIYKTLKKEFGREIPENRSFYQRLENVDQFMYNKKFVDFSNIHWTKLDDLHREKRADLALSLSKIIYSKKIEENTQKLLSSLEKSINQLLSKIRKEEENLKVKEEVESIQKTTYCTTNLNEFLKLFKAISNQVSVTHYEYKVRFIESINEANNYSKPEIFKHKVDIRKS